MRLTVLAGTFRPERCGVVAYTDSLLRHLQRRRIHPRVVTTSNATVAPGLDIEAAIPSWDPRCLPALARAVLRSDPDIVHIQQAPSTYRFRRTIFFLPLLLRLAGMRVPIVLTLHEYGQWDWPLPFLPPSLAERLHKWAERSNFWDRDDGPLLALSDAIITTNQEARSIMLARHPALAARTHTVPLASSVEVCPVDRSAARQAILSLTGWPADAEIILFFGFVHPVKGLETLLDAMPEVMRRRPNARLLIVGGTESLALGGPDAATYASGLRARAGALGVSGLVYATGHIPAGAASTLLTGADLGVLPFNHGANLKSSSLLTLFAHGLPTVTTRHEPLEPLLEGGGVARVVPPRCPHALATEIIDLLERDDERLRLSRGAAAYAGSWSWDHVVERHLAIYEGVLERSR